MKKLIVTFIILLLALPASAQIRKDLRPQLYPNKYLNQVGQAKANQDIAACTQLATQNDASAVQTGDRAKSGLRSAARGAALGTAGGAIMGNTGRGAAAGATMGVASSAIKGVSERGTRDPAFQQYVNACLEDKGYKVLKWN